MNTELVPEVYPNPTSHIWSVKLQYPNSEMITIRLFDMHGYELFRQHTSAQKEYLEISPRKLGLRAGIYFYK